MKILGLCFMALLFAVPVAAEGLYCDAQSGDKVPPTHYKVVFEDGSETLTPYSEPIPGVALVLETLPATAQTIKVYAVKLDADGKMEGQSIAAPFLFLSKPSSIKVDDH